MRRSATRAADDVELVVVESQRERLDAHRAARAVEAAVLDLQSAAPLERVDHFFEQIFLFGKCLFAAADEEDKLAPRILEPLWMERVPADVVHKIVHAGLITGPFEELGQAGADAGGNGGRDGHPLRSARDPGAVDANVHAPLPLVAHEWNVPADRLELPVSGGEAYPEQGGDVRAGELAPREEHGDQLGSPLDRAEPSEVRLRHDPTRIIRSSADHKHQEGVAPESERHQTTHSNRKGGRYGDAQVLVPSRNPRPFLARPDGAHARGAGHGNARAARRMDAPLAAAACGSGALRPQMNRLGRGASLGPADGPYLPARSSAAGELIAAIGRAPRNHRPGRHLEPLQYFSRSRFDSPQFALVTFPGAVPELSVDPGDPGDEAVGLDRAKNRPRLGIDLMDLPVPILPHPERPFGPREPRVAAAAGGRDGGEHTAGPRTDPLGGILGELKQGLAADSP